MRLLFLYLPSKGLNDALATKLFGFVYLRFKPCWYWWELVESSRKLCAEATRTHAAEDGAPRPAGVAHAASNEIREVHASRSDPNPAGATTKPKPG